MTQDYFIIAGGPSAKGLDFRPFLNHGYILGVNDAVLNAPCHGVASIDGRWMRHRFGRIKDTGVDMFFRKTSVKKFLGDVEHPDLKTFRVDCTGYGLSKDPELYHAKNSGFFALQHAYFQRPPRVFLFGFDLTLHQGKEHWYDTYEWRKQKHHIASAREWAEDHNAAAPRLAKAGIEVFNVSDVSIITAYPKISYKDVLQCLK